MNNKPCREAENNSGEFWECRAWKYAECEYQQYDYNPDNTVNICKCGYVKSLCDSCVTKGCIFQSGIVRSHCDFYKVEGEDKE